jgi:hypothetical protein
MSKKEREPGYNNEMKIECEEELKRILLEQGIKEVIDQGFEVTKKMDHLLEQKVLNTEFILKDIAYVW